MGASFRQRCYNGGLDDENAHRECGGADGCDRQRSDLLRKEATVRLSETRARLQAIEAAANRRLSQIETDLMLQRLAASQEHFPLALEMASLEEAALRELDAAPMLEKSKEPRTQSS